LLKETPLNTLATLCLTSILAAAPLAAWADDAAPPAGAADLPAICTDRPTKSNVPCTVDAGHFQLESDLFNGTFQRVGGVTTDTYLATNPTLKYGVNKALDLEVNIAPYAVVHTSGGGAHSDLGGVGDLYLRAKWAFYVPSNGPLTASLIPYIKAPSARLGIGNGAVEGGALVPVSYKLSDKLVLTTVPELDAYKDAAGAGRHLNTAQLINLAWSLPASVTVYGEVWGDWNFDPAGTIRQSSADVAAAWGMTQYLQFDAGLNFGLNRQTPGVQAYVGIAQKF
jgi:hypothetical protein